MSVSDLRNEQSRQIVDVEQVFGAYVEVRNILNDRFAGSMFWREIGGGTYLYRNRGGASRSLGAKSSATERAQAAFRSGRDKARERAASLAARLNMMAPVNRALGIGRLPLTSARVLRHLGSAGLVGNAIVVAGTTTLFAYERMAAVQIESGMLSTGDIDLLYDARRRLRIAAPLLPASLLALLRKADRSFETSRGSFRAINRDGFMVDLIKPAARHRFASSGRTSIGGADDLQAVEIEGLGWLVNSPKHRVVVIDERGFPVEMVVPDPRSFALHKAWLAEREDRDPIKRQRDLGQARLVAGLVGERLSLRFDSDDLSALPDAMRKKAADIMPPAKRPTQAGLEPDWE